MAQATKCKLCGTATELRRIRVRLSWGSSNIRVFTLALCGACAAAFLDQVESAAVDAQVELVGAEWR
jgi:hypothetical protein